MQCVTCGHVNRETARFCDGCGTAFTPHCPNCGVELRPAARFCDGCGHPLSSPTPVVPATPSHTPATLAAGRYRVVRLLGEGSRKRVYLAHDARLERDIAVAVIKTEGLDEAGLARVRREARAMGRLGDHPHIVTVHDVGEDNGRPYIVSQYMSGGSVDDLLKHAPQHRLPLDQTLRLAHEITRALEHAHERGIIHRDLKPSNIWLTADGTAKLGDFGLAMALDRSRLTLEGMMVGTVTYMPPEQALGRAADARSDLYALGALLYEMVTGRPPFLGDDAVAIISQHINTPPVAPSWHTPDVPRAVEALILRLLAKAPEDRPETASAVNEALRAIATTVDAIVAPAPADANPLDRLAGGVFVGREHEMDQLRAGLEGALSGRGRLLLLVGEPGIGKTRTAEELVTYARLRRAQVLWGRCYEGEGAPVYWPWVQLIRSYVHEREPAALLSEMGSGAGAIAQMVSEVRDRLPGVTPPPALDPEQARFRLFDGVSAFLKNAAKNQPLVLVLDDLHWADKPSLLLLDFLARELRAARLLVVGTYRDVELGRQHPLTQALGDLSREQLAERVVLRGLTARDVARFIEMTAGLRPPEALVAAVYKETEGNPFFVNEVVRLLVADGRLAHPETVKSWSVGIPQSVREVVGRRLDRLSHRCNQVLSIGSIIGREFSLDLLQHVSGLGGDPLLDVLDEAVAARVINEVPRVTGCYSFAHALIRETLYEELSATRRIRLHRQIAEALEALYGSNPEPHLAELAYHFFEAAQGGGDVDRAIAYAVRAGDRAAGMMAHEEAARQYDIGLQALDLRQPPAEPERCELLLKLSETLWRTGEYGRAREVALQAADLARRLGTAEQLGRAALAYGGPLLAFAAVIRDETLVSLLEEARAALGAAHDALRARLLGRLAEEITFSDPFERRATLCNEAIALARRVADPAVIMPVLRNAHWSTWVPETVAERLDAAREMIRLGQQLGDPAALIEGHAFHFWDLLEFGRVADAEHDFQELTRLAEDVRQPYLRWAVGLCRILRAFVHGRLAEIEALGREVLEAGQESQNQNAALVFGVQLMALLREQGNQEHEPIVLSAITMYPAIATPLQCALVVAHCDAGRHTDARAIFEQLARQSFSDLPRHVAWLFCIAYLSESCACLGDAERARILYDLLLPFADRNVTIGPVLALGAAARYLGLLAATLQRTEDAARHFEDALAMNATMGMRQALARTQLDYAALLWQRRQPGDRSKALGLANCVLKTAQELGMKVVVEKALAFKLQAQGVDSADLTTSIDAVTAAVQRESPDLRRHAAPDGTVTLLFTDIEGSSILTERLGDQRWMQLLRAHNTIVREHVAAYGGFEVKSQGDGFMLAFHSGRRALQCAIAMQRAFAKHSAGHPEEPIRVRIGVHTGEVIKEADDFFGRNVILAARIASAAQAGEILVSSVLKELTESIGDVHFTNARDVELKGLSGTRKVYAIAWDQ